MNAKGLSLKEALEKLLEEPPSPPPPAPALSSHVASDEDKFTEIFRQLDNLKDRVDRLYSATQREIK